MKILCIIPPYIPSYFNAGHHSPVFQVAAYLRQQYPHFDIKAIDGAALNMHWKGVCDELVKQYDLVAIFCDFDGIDTLSRLLYYVKAFNKATKVITFGRLCKQIPKFFCQDGVDAVAHRGDYECSLENYIESLLGNNYNPDGVMFKNGVTTDHSPVLDADKWVMPDVNEIPYSAYNSIYKNDLDKFCGIPHRQELVVPIARGCPINCSFCDVPFMQGKRERRYDVHKTLAYIKDSFNKQPFEYMTFYSPTFTLNHVWVKQLCNLLKQESRVYPWKCTTALPTLNEPLLKLMAESGCVRISLGIESFARNVFINLPKCKQEARDDYIQVVNWCKKYGIELNCFIILGLPGDSPADARYTIEECLKSGARVRPTIYTPYHLMREDMSAQDIAKFNRQLLYSPEYTPQEIEAYYELFYQNKADKPTTVMEKIQSDQAA